MPGETRIYPSHNNYSYKPGAGVSGICPGASALWCKAARSGNYTFNPHKPGKSLELSKSLTMKFTEQIRGPQAGRLKALLEEAGVRGTEVTQQVTGMIAVRSVLVTRGVHLVLGGTHVMGVSSLPGSYYFYDNMNGLYRCDDGSALEECIRRLRSKEDEWDLTGLFGWYAVKCT